MRAVPADLHRWVKVGLQKNLLTGVNFQQGYTLHNIVTYKPGPEGARNVDLGQQGDDTHTGHLGDSLVTTVL